VDGKIIGEHQGLMCTPWASARAWHRRSQDATEEAWYVVDKEVERNTLVVAQGNTPLYSDGLVASQLHWVDRTPFARRAAAPSRPAIGRKISPA
jgi:tRNA-specific 2-thiouridylase